MKEISIQGNLSPSLTSQFKTNQSKEETSSSFSDSLKSAIGKVSELRQEADKAVHELSTGNEIDIHNTMIALEKADVSFQLMLQVRNKIISAYETVMHMNV